MSNLSYTNRGCNYCIKLVFLLFFLDPDLLKLNEMTLTFYLSLILLKKFLVYSQVIPFLVADFHGSWCEPRWENRQIWMAKFRFEESIIAKDYDSSIFEVCNTWFFTTFAGDNIFQKLTCVELNAGTLPQHSQVLCLILRWTRLLRKRH